MLSPCRAKASLHAGGAGDTSHAGGFFAGAAVLLGGFFVIAVPLDITDEAFLLAHLLETFYHLLNGFTYSCFYF